MQLLSCPDSPNETLSANRSGHGRPAPGSIGRGQQVSRYPPLISVVQLVYGTRHPDPLTHAFNCTSRPTLPARRRVAVQGGCFLLPVLQI